MSYSVVHRVGYRKLALGFPKEVDRARDSSVIKDGQVGGNAAGTSGRRCKEADIPELRFEDFSPD